MKINFTKNEFIGCLIFCTFLKVSSLEYLAPVLNDLWDMIKIMVFLILLGVYIFSSLKMGLNKIFIYILAYGVSLLISTLINKGSIFQFIVAFSGILSIYFYIDIFIIKLHNRLETMILPIKVLLFINIISWIINPKGMYVSLTNFGTYYSSENWILGSKNAYFPFIFFVLVINYIRNIKMNGKIKLRCEDIFLYCLCCINIFFISKSSTTIIGSVMLLGYLLICKINIRKTKIIFHSCIALTVVIFLGLVVFREYNPAIKLVSNLLGKDITLTGRTYIWDNSIKAISNKVFFGYGFENVMKTLDLLHQSTSHNKYLWILYRGGIVNFIICVNIIKIILNKIYINIENHYSQLFIWVLFIIFTVWQTEVYDNNMLIFAIILLSYYIDKLIKKEYKN